MDLSSLKDQVSNLSLYDIKAGVRKVQNAVMNYTEMEAKVREATNNEPWGTSSTLMQEIANGTHSYHLLNEIMPMIYKRFTEKAAEEWRQIYKALQLLEFLIKNGSERVIDDARSHVPLLKMLRQFHYIDQNGKDQGINVRNRAKELAELLSDVDRIRSERKKSRSNRNKFGGVEGGAMGGSSMSGGSRYGGFGSEEYGGYSGGVYGDGGGFGGRDSGFQDTQNRRDRFEEYDEYDEGSTTSARRNQETSSAPPKAKKAEPPKPKEPEIDLLEDIPPETPPKEFSNGKKPASSSFDNGFGSLQSGGTADDDDFDDFQSATPTVSNTGTTASSTAASSIPTLPPPMNTGIPTQSTTFAAPKATAPNATFSAPVSNITSPAPSTSGVTSPSGPNYFVNMNAPAANFSSPTLQQQPARPSSQQPTPSAYQPSTPNYFTSVPAPQQAPAASSTSAGGRPTPTSTASFSKPAAKPSASGGDAFGNIWTSASAGAGIKKTSTASSGSGPNLASLQKEKASQGLWGMGASQQPTPAQNRPIGAPGTNGQKGTGGGALDDLLG